MFPFDKHGKANFSFEDGPSAGKLLPADLILRINGEDVEKAPRDHVIELVRACKDVVTLTVCQPQSDNVSFTAGAPTEHYMFLL